MIRSIDELSSMFDSYAPSFSDRNLREKRLERMIRLLDRLSHPELDYRTYHTAGSKGKGTTSAFLAAILEGSGRRCGLYTSPHLYSIKERFMLPFSFFPEELYIDTANLLLSKISSFTLPSFLGVPSPTTFELYTAYSYLLFKEYGCTDAVIETGLGGRLDATNTLSPEAVLLTPIELEHTEVLGKTIAAVACEKSKVMRKGVPAFISKQPVDAERVFNAEGSILPCPVTFLSDAMTGFSSRTLRDGERMEAVIDGMKYSLDLSMTTRAMAENASLAILASSRIGFLTEKGLENLEKVSLPGRFEKLDVDGHFTVVDSAHTVHSAKSTADAFSDITSDPETAVLIFSAVEGKDIEGMMRVLFPAFRRIIISKPGSFKKSNPEGIYNLAKSIYPEKNITLESDPDKALENALREGDDILITGSFYLPAEMKKIRSAHES